MNTVVYRPHPDGMTREYWEFNLHAFAVVLVGYGLQRRAKPNKGSYRAPDRSERWHRDDERCYHSGLPRPSEVPADILREAISKLDIDIYIGWLNADHHQGSVKVVPAGDLK